MARAYENQMRKDKVRKEMDKRNTSKGNGRAAPRPEPRMNETTGMTRDRTMAPPQMPMPPMPQAQNLPGGMTMPSMIDPRLEAYIKALQQRM